MSWVAVAIAGSSVVSAGAGIYASDKAADAAGKGSQAGIAEQRRQFDIIMGLQQPYAVTGTGALNKIAQLYGLPYQGYQAPAASAAGGGVAAGALLSAKDIIAARRSGQSVDEILKTGYLGGKISGKQLRRLRAAGLSPEDIQKLQLGPQGVAAQAANAANPIITPEGPDPSVFTDSPDYQFRQREGAAAVDRMAASRVGALSGNAVRAQTEYASELASTEYGNFFNRLATIAGIGQGAANVASNAASATGSNVSQLLMQGGNARASGILGATNSVTGALNSGLNNYLLLRGGYFGGGAPAGILPGGSGTYGALQRGGVT